MKFFLIIPEEFPDSLACTWTDHDQGLRRLRRPALSKDAYSSQHSWNKMWYRKTWEDGLNQLLLSTMETDFSTAILWLIQCISRCMHPASPFPSEQYSWKLVCRCLALLNRLKKPKKTKNNLCFHFGMGFPVCSSGEVCMPKFHQATPQIPRAHQQKELTSLIYKQKLILNV